MDPYHLQLNLMMVKDYSNKKPIQIIIKQYNPNMSVIEKIFVGSGSISSLKLGMARGASMIALAEAGLIVNELSPKFVKKTVTGYGSASKEQIKSMIEKLLNIVPKNEDSSDALAIAISVNILVMTINVLFQTGVMD